MPLGIRVERASPLEIFFAQACEGEGKQGTLPFFLLLYDNVYEALRDFIRHFGDKQGSVSSTLHGGGKRWGAVMPTVAHAPSAYRPTLLRARALPPAPADF
jgi:hypothetical protein